MKDCSIDNVILLDPGMLHPHGHHHAWNSILQNSLDHLGIAHKCFFSRALSKEVLAHYHDAFPHFSYSPYGDLLSGTDSFEKTLERSFIFYQDLLRISRFVTENTLVFAHSMGTAEILGTSLWFASLPEEKRPHIALNVHFLLHPPTDLTRRSYSIAVKNFHNSRKVRLYSVPDHLISMLREVTGMPVSYMPAPFIFEAWEPLGKADDLVFGIAGVAHPRKNLDLLPTAIEKYFLRGGRGRFMLHMELEDSASSLSMFVTIEKLRKLEGRYPDKCKVLSQYLNSEEYYTLLRQCSVGMIPYSSIEHHKYRASQFFQEITCLGIPAIVCGGGWLQHEVEKLNNGGLVIPEPSAQCLVDALLEFDRSAAQRIEAAQKVGAEYRKGNNLQTFLKTLLPNH